MIIPKLRFREFTDSWKAVSAEIIFDSVVEKGCPDEPVLTIIQGSGTVSRAASGRSIQFDETTVGNYKKVQKGDFIIHLRSFQGGLEIANSSGIVSPAYTILRNKIPIASMFYKNYFRSNKFINQTLCSAVEGIRDGRQISYAQFKRLQLLYTSLPEQQKIADFLSTADEKIELQQAIVASLEKLKKGLMQKIFSRELHFNNQNDEEFPEWEYVKLIGISSNITKGTTPSRFDEDGNIRFIKIESLFGVNIDNNKCLYISEDIQNTELQRSILQVNDILFAIAGATIGKCGIVRKHNLPANTNQALSIIRLKNPAFNEYVLQTLQSHIMKRYIYQNIAAGAQPNLSLEQIGNFVLPIPCDLERNKITCVFIIFDKIIETEKQILTHWQNIKKGLLQQIFV